MRGWVHLLLDVDVFAIRRSVLLDVGRVGCK